MIDLASSPWTIALWVITVVTGFGIVAFAAVSILATIGAGRARRQDRLSRSYDRARRSIIPPFPSSID